MAETPYEFTSDQDRLIADLARKMKNVGRFLSAVGLLSLAGAAAMLTGSYGGWFFGLLLAGIYFSLTGTWTLRSGRQFHDIVETRGQDIEHTMRALRELDRYYTLKFWLVVAYFLIILSALLFPGRVGSAV